MENEQGNTINSDDVNIKKSHNLNSENFRNLDFKKINLLLTMAIKIIVIVALLSMYIAGRSIYKQYAHAGPSCEAQQSDFQYWLDKAKSGKGKIVAIHENKLQTINGTTQCYGTFLTKSGDYKGWEGSITELASGEVIGRANLY
ncbi:hypothetical protein [Vibrio sp. MEBiC08052]|uniref:hypothetical protein n=1 Tax=Vibrio sp. MEBiC08052 TaxID=1761910 RepID=UPI000740782B|nr:hypothetical protein [Vibrio sp. MEBiC08052]KUI99379.1 hypothetical protein VRK_14630 [Vibrio sp. MEBiC08052]